MRATFKLVNPDDVEATLTITARVKDWRALRDRISGQGWPEWQFRASITDAIRQAEQAFYGSAPEQEGGHD